MQRSPIQAVFGLFLAPLVLCSSASARGPLIEIGAGTGVQYNAGDQSVRLIFAVESGGFQVGRNGSIEGTLATTRLMSVSVRFGLDPTRLDDGDPATAIRYVDLASDIAQIPVDAPGMPTDLILGSIRYQRDLAIGITNRVRVHAVGFQVGNQIRALEAAPREWEPIFHFAGSFIGLTFNERSDLNEAFETSATRLGFGLARFDLLTGFQWLSDPRGRQSWMVRFELGASMELDAGFDSSRCGVICDRYEAWARVTGELFARIRAGLLKRTEDGRIDHYIGLYLAGGVTGVAGRNPFLVQQDFDRGAGFVEFGFEAIF